VLEGVCPNPFELYQFEVDTKRNDHMYLTVAQDDVVLEKSCDLLID
jgi:hypothetical protein